MFVATLYDNLNAVSLFAKKIQFSSFDLWQTVSWIKITESLTDCYLD